MAFDSFLKIDGIKGGSHDSTHKDQIRLESYSFGVSNSGTMGFDGGGGSGNANFQDFHFTMNESPASPKLFKACATGEHIKMATLSVRKAGGKQQDYYQVKFTDILISSYQTGNHQGSEHTSESISFNYAKIEVSFKPQNQKGELEAAIEAGYDVKAQKAV
jgi:type VI secretion system secreted protein Hcp